ncbi:MAG: hypothetical protein ACKOCH_14745, partial [Bacteroidota bacterium]
MLDQERQSLENKLSDLYAEKRKADTELALTNTLTLATGPESVSLELPDSIQTPDLNTSKKTKLTPAKNLSEKTEEIQEMPLPHLGSET